MNSDITKYGLIGRSCERRLASQRPSHSPLSLSICCRAPVERAFLPIRSFAAPTSCANTSFASPRIGIAVSLALCRSRASFVAWMIVFPVGMIGVEMLCRVKDVPIAKITSDSNRKCRPCPV